MEQYVIMHIWYYIDDANAIHNLKAFQISKYYVQTN